MRRLSSEELWLRFGESRWTWIAAPLPQGVPLPRSGYLVGKTWSDILTFNLSLSPPWVTIPTLGRLASSEILGHDDVSFQTSFGTNAHGVVYYLVFLYDNYVMLNLHMNF